MNSDKLDILGIDENINSEEKRRLYINMRDGYHNKATQQQPKQLDERSVEDIDYVVIDFDNYKVQSLKDYGKKVVTHIVGHKDKAINILQGYMTKLIKPNVYVDSYGNIWCRINANGELSEHNYLTEEKKVIKL